MKKIIVLLLMVVVFLSCDLDPGKYITFASVSDPYFSQYGYPEEVYKYKSDGYESVSWWYWTKGFNVDFVLSQYNNVYGWAVSSTYSFSPIR